MKKRKKPNSILKMFKVTRQNPLFNFNFINSLNISSAVNFKSLCTYTQYTSYTSRPVTRDYKLLYKRKP